MNAMPSSIYGMTRKERLFGAIHQQVIDRPPVWLMRQAGRYLPSYQQVKAQYTFAEMCSIPAVAADVSIQPYEILGVDAIIVFNDILIPFQHMGLQVEFTEHGPAVIPPVRCEEEVRALHLGRFDETPPVHDTLRTIRQKVGEETPIFGFAGAPFTMAAYAVEGVMSKTLRHIKTLLNDAPEVLHVLLEKITETVIEYLQIQVKAGADVVQIFDTWAGALNQEEYRVFALPYQQRIIAAIQESDTPVVLYVKDSSPFLAEMKASGASVLSVDWRVDLQNVYNTIGGGPALQGNLDPTALYAAPERVSRLTEAMLDRFGRTTGHIVNLGHGILPETPVESVQALVETVRAYSYGA